MTATTRSVRQYWRNMQGRCVLNFNWDAINEDSTVHIAAAEWNPDPANLATSPRFVGDASITVRNVVPHGPPADPNHGVTFVVTVDWPHPLNIVTDIVVIENDQPIVQPPVLDWVRLAFTMQPQQQSNWCWCADTVSISNYYGASLTQCTFANTLLGRTDCCTNGSSAACNVQNNMPNALGKAGHLASWKASAPTMSDLSSEIDAARPVSLRVQWNGGGGHFIAVDGYLPGPTTYVAVGDPIYGPSDIRLNDLITNYQSIGTIDETHFTKA